MILTFVLQWALDTDLDLANRFVDQHQDLPFHQQHAGCDGWDLVTSAFLVLAL